VQIEASLAFVEWWLKENLLAVSVKNENALGVMKNFLAELLENKREV
jgi:hypothetical protein